MLQALMQQLHTGIEFVVARTMTGMAGYQDDFFVRGRGADAATQNQDQEEERGSTGFPNRQPPT